MNSIDYEISSLSSILFYINMLYTVKEPDISTIPYQFLSLTFNRHLDVQ